MKKLAHLFLALVLGCTAVNAQNKIDKIDITYGEELPDDDQKLVAITGEANGKIYGLAIKGKDKYMLKIYTANAMKEIASKEIVIPEFNDKEVDFEEIYLLNGKLYVVGSVYNKKEKIFNLVATPLSEEGKLSKDGIIMFKAQVEKKSERGDFYFRQTQDETGLLVMHTSYFKKEDAVKYEIKLFNDNLKEVFATVEKVKFDDNLKDYDFQIADFEVGLNDDIFVVISEGYRDKKQKERVESFEIHAYKSSNNYTKEVINIAMKDKSILNCNIVPHGKTLRLTGFYAGVRESGRTFKDLKGVYSAIVDLSTNTPDNVKFHEFDYETKVKLIGERRAKKGKDVKPLYNIIYTVGREDGGMIMLSEYQMVVVGASSGLSVGGVGVGFTPITYIKNEIIVTSLSADGSHEWSNVLPKEQAASVTTMFVGLAMGSNSGSFSVGGAIAIPVVQMGKGPEYIGAIPLYKDGIMNILINDNIKNKGITDIEEIKSMGNYNNAVPSLFTFDKTGKITRKDPEEAIKNELVLRPGVRYKISENEYLVYSSRKKKNKLGRMILQD